MPELPEVETTRRGILSHIQGKRISDVVIRQPILRWPIPPQLRTILIGRTLLSVERRAKYLLLKLSGGTLIAHLGMSGSLRVISVDIAPQKHDHVDIVFDRLSCLRLRDPRRFGALLWTEQDASSHPLLHALGPEPLSNAFDADYLFQQTRRRKTPIKQLLMNSQIIAGVGNIYANEALFMSGIHPKTPAGRISRQRCERLVSAIKEVLILAIEQGGTTLRDFSSAEGKPGYFGLALQVYDRAGQACLKCGRPIKKITQAQRSTYYCGSCQR